MKKLVFTALAVVAFSGAAMAKTGEVKEDVVVSDKLKVEVPSKLVEDEDNKCMDNAMNFIDFLDIDDDVINEQIWQILIADC
ncbi:hypothetical protein IQ05_00613 [Flavobacterium tiangeerense]|uniref:Uncharacterized protein n=1 Tax=Flavobacterium tiangeerense TaxID=459471 RepID=A0ABY3FN62_9FLAO|nr:hypothetical protein [Flavobacterium tiangeerense]TWI02367.1 hypothetical protein IQ05_00613 [Flavobacterium tiangeerense]